MNNDCFFHRTAGAPSVPPENERKKIPEITGVPNLSIGSPNVSIGGTNEIANDFDDGTSAIEFYNPPCSVWVYTDHKLKTEFVCVLLPIFSGERDIKFELSEDGNVVTIHYTWPSQFYRASELFKASIDKGEMSTEHPKVHGFVSNMIELGVTENSKPRGKMIIKLPCQVKREIGSWKKQAVNVEETKMILLEFTAYQKSLLVNDMDTSLTFD